MDYFNFGGLHVSRMTLGTVQLGMTYGIANTSGKPDSQTSREILESAWHGGITCFDTAHMYGESEKVLGDFFATRQEPLQPAFVTKMHLTGDRNTAEKTLETQMMVAVETSLQKLQIKQIPIMLLHNPGILYEHGKTVARFMKKLKEQGVIRSAGVSLDPFSNTFDDIWPVLHEDVYEAVQVPINILDHRLIRNGALSRLYEAGKTIFARSIFLQGLIFLTEKEWIEKLNVADHWLKELQAMAELEGMSTSQMAVSFVRDMKEISSVVIGAETSLQVKSNLSLMGGPQMSEKSRYELSRKMSDIPDRVVNPLLWTKGGP